MLNHRPEIPVKNCLVELTKTWYKKMVSVAGQGKNFVFKPNFDQISLVLVLIKYSFSNNKMEFNS